MRKLLYATVFALAVSPALADTYSMTGFSMAPGYQNINITSPINTTVSVGQVILHSTTDGDLAVWCLDLTDTLFQPYVYNVAVYNGGNLPGLPLGGLDATQRRQIASLIAFGMTVSPDGDSDAATQLAIWRAEYGVGLNYTGLSASLTAKVALLLLDSANGGLIDCPGCQLHVLSDAPLTPNQAMGFVTVPVPAPLAGAGIPGLLAAFGMGGFFWKRRKAIG